MTHRVILEVGELFMCGIINRAFENVQRAVLLADEIEGLAIGFPDGVEVMTVELGDLAECAVIAQPYIRSAGTTFMLAPYILEPFLILIEELAVGRYVGAQHRE